MQDISSVLLPKTWEGLQGAAKEEQGINRKGKGAFGKENPDEGGKESMALLQSKLLSEDEWACVSEHAVICWSSYPLI